MDSEQKKWEAILQKENLGMERGRSRWLILSDNAEGFQNGRDASECQPVKAIKQARKSQRPLELVSCTCSVCSSEFKGKHSDSIYCSKACKQKAYRQRSVTKTFTPINEGN